MSTARVRARMARSRLGRLARASTRAQTHAGGFERRLVWMLGSPRSGSTWLVRVLAEHQGIVAIHEPLIGLYLSPFLSDLPGGSAPDLDGSNFSIRRVQRNKRSQFFAEEFSGVWVPALGRLLRERFFAEVRVERGSAAAARCVVVIKEPNGSQSADILARALPQSRLLFLLRDGRDVVDSELAANLRGGWATSEFPGLRGIAEEERLAFVVQSAYKWLWRTEMVQEALRNHPGPQHTVRYEDLLLDPQRHLRELFAWLELEPRADELARWTERHSFERLEGGAKGPEKFFRSASPGAWRENLRPAEAEAVEAILAPKLRELGYLAESGDSSAQPLA